MSKHAIIGIIVLCFVSTFMTMVYQYASRGYLSESNPPISGGPGGHHAVVSHEGASHEAATPGPAVETPMSVETPVSGEAPPSSEVPQTPAVTPTP